MRKILKSISLFFMVLALVLIPFSIFKNTETTAEATFNDSYVQELSFKNNAMFVTYAGDTLVGVDKDGYFYKMTDDGLFNKTGYKFSIVLKAFTLSSAFYKGSNNYIAYANNTIVIAGTDGTNTILYYSADTGTTWGQVTLGIKTEVGYPISIITGNGYFALITAVVNGSEKYTSANIYSSTNGSEWTLATSGVYLDYQFSFSNGYFFRTEYTSEADPVVYYSTNLNDWSSFVSPIGIIAGDSVYSNPQLSIVYTNNTFCIFGFDKMYTSASLTGAWKQVEVPSVTSFKLENVFKAAPYQNGAILCSNDYIWYADVSLDGLSNLKILMSKVIDFTVEQTGDDSLYGNTVAESTNSLVIGFNNFYGQTLDSSYNLAHFKIFNKLAKHTVTFQDWNGNIISSVEVVDGETVVAPTNPTREGYTFVSWSGDISQAITEDTTFIAQYKINDCSVLFIDYNGQTIKQVYVEYGTTLSASDIPSPTRAGYQFVGWDKDTDAVIKTNTTFTAQYTQEAKLVLKYPAISGTSGLINQFHKTTVTEKVFTFRVGDTTQSAEYIDFVNDVLNPWYNDFADDGDYDYDVKFISWDKEVPKYIYEDTVVTAVFERLLTVRLEYYTQLRFKVAEDSLYYATYIGYMKIEKLVTSGTVINVEDFKRSDVDYEVYNPVAMLL
ncbi:MAG: InlB B-repeat-containing protein [Clostridia bacterium]|nr:InlB B-repeat-containing protein [Clostridia bacterium]